MQAASTLRKRLFCRQKPKTLHGREINGCTLYEMAECYVEAINNGAVPNIETAWTYVCANESRRALTEAVSQFEDALLKRAKREQRPTPETELKVRYRSAKQAALRTLREGAIG